MLQNNPLLAQLKQQIRASTKRVEGVIKATDKHFGFLETDSGDSYFVPPPAMKQVLHGDRVEAIIHEDGDKTSAEPEKLLSAGLERFLAKVQKRNGRLAVVPDDPAIRLALRADIKRGLDETTIGDGDWVMADLLRHPLKANDRGFFARIQTLVSSASDPASPWRVILARHDLPRDTPPGDRDWVIRDEGLAREDLTEQVFFTIDAAATTDMDDALHIGDRDDGGWELTVAVADPTAYVHQGHPVDNEARERGFTLYLPGQNINMLPGQLAEKLCSLRRDEDRPALACTLVVNADGSLGDYRFYTATIRSRASLAYDAVSDWLEGAGTWAPDDHIAHQLRALAKLTEARRDWRGTAGVRDRPDYVFEFDEAGKVLAVRSEARRLASYLVEEAMIAANTCGADFLASRAGRGLFNVHHAFDADKVDTAHQFLATQEITIDREALTDPARHRELRDALASRGDPWLDARLRQLQSLATIACQPGPHFGLGVSAYATWTSPIRKYSDMVNHRLIKAVLKGDLGGEDSAAPCSGLPEQLSARRRRHRLAERHIRDWLYTDLLRPAIKDKQTFAAEVVAINKKGMRVRLVDNGATAFIPAGLIHDDRAQLVLDNKEGLVKIGDEMRFKLGSELTIMVTEARTDTTSLIARVAG